MAHENLSKLRVWQNVFPETWSCVMHHAPAPAPICRRLYAGAYAHAGDARPEITLASALAATRPGWPTPRPTSRQQHARARPYNTSASVMHIPLAASQILSAFSCFRTKRRGRGRIYRVGPGRRWPSPRRGRALPDSEAISAKYRITVESPRIRTTLGFVVLYYSRWSSVKVERRSLYLFTFQAGIKLLTVYYYSTHLNRM